MRRAATMTIALVVAAIGCGEDRTAPFPSSTHEVVKPPDEPPTPRTPDPAVQPAPDEERLDADAGPDAGLATSPLPPGKPMLLEFTRDHCLPCEIMAPWMKELRKEHAGRVQIVEINIDRKENKPLARYFKARSIPTQVYVDERGRELSRHVGLATKPQMQRTMKRHGFLPAPHGDHADPPTKKKKTRK
jgi:thioredoxin 1